MVNDIQARDSAPADSGLRQDTGPDVYDADPQEDLASSGPDVSDLGDDVQGEDAVPSDLYDPSSIPLDQDLFPLGVQAGESNPETAMVWTRYLGSQPITVVVFSALPGQDGGELVAETTAIPGDSGFTHHELTGLSPGTRYRYVFITEDEDEDQRRRSAIGTFRSALADGSLEPLVFGGVSCTSNGYAPFPALSRAAAAELDFFILGGDTTYNDGDSSREEFRSSWASQLSAGGYQDLLQSTSIMASWDDHEVDNNWDPETIEPAKLNAATDSFFEHLPLRRDQDAPAKIWRRHRWGDTVEVFVLDCRAERRPSTRNSPEAEYISPAQYAWLVEGLTTSTAVFKIIVNSVPITNMPFYYVSTSDRWEGYAAQRDALLNAIREVSGVLWVSGDFHFGAIARIEPDGVDNDKREVFMGPGGQFGNPAYLALGIGSDQFDYLTGTNNYTRFRADPLASPPTITVEFVENDGTIGHSQVLSFPE